MVLKGFFANINMKLKKNLEVMDVGAELLHEELHHPLGTCDLVFGLHIDVSEKSFRDHS